jgi:hypothetical protein
VYANSNYAGGLEKRKSLTIYVFTLSRCAIVGRRHYKSTISFFYHRSKVYNNDRGSERTNLDERFGE